MSFIIWSLIFGSISFFIAKSEKKTVSENQVDNSPLTGKLLLYVIILAIVDPVITSSVFYYAWRKQLPEKAKKANMIGWGIFLVAFTIIFIHVLMSSK
jgi:hypothetical protein